jgi:hypothetical protein
MNVSKMKKFLMILIAIIGFSVTMSAQSCTINGADDGSTVAVKSCYMSGDNVTVNVINDSKDIMANITVTVEVTYKWGSSTKVQRYEGREIALSGVTTKIELPIDKKHTEDNRYEATSVKAISISGKKCN